jgi:uncharacterized protein YciI
MIGGRRREGAIAMATKKPSEDKKDDSRQEERREFLKRVGSIGAIAAVGATLPIDQTFAQQKSESRDPQVSLDAKSGVVMVNHAAVRAVAGKLRDRMKKSPSLRRRFFANPRELLGAVGLNEEAQLEILRVDADFKMANSPFVNPAFLDFCFCTSCCCTSCCLTCWSTSKMDFDSLDEPFQRGDD